MATVPSPEASTLRFGVFELDAQAGELRKAGKLVRLRPQAARVLAVLARRAGQVATREELKDEIWGRETFVDFEHGLNLCVRQIRAALDDDADTPRYIETLPRRGYRFIAAVEEIAQQQNIGRYRIVGSIGAGGMGEVLLAQDTHLGREVAIKVLPTSALENEDARKRFRREAEILCKLNHPNIATVYDFVSQEGKDFLVMEYIRGVPLTEKLSGGPLPEADVLRLGLQLAEGMAAAHERGIVHRDLKPGNLRVTPDGWLKVLDFGLARQAAGLREDSATESAIRPGEIAGTLCYMAPEQLRGEAVDARADIYAIGTILYEMAAGKAPFEGRSTTALIEAILHHAPEPARRLNNAVSPRLEEIILKCLEKDRASRYQSAKEIAIDLRRLAPSATTVTFPARRRRFSWRAAALVAVAFAAIAAIALANPEQWLSRWSGSSAPVRTVAVLPLQNLSGDAGQEYFADGITEALTTDLARMENLQVISHTTAMRYAKADKPLQTIARELNSDVIVEGSVQRSGNRVRITAQLIRASNDRHLWADTYERDVRDLLAVQDEVAAAIAREIQTRLGGPKPVALHKPVSTSPEAYETYLKGNYYLDNWQLSKSIDYFNEVIKLDPNFAPAYAHMARAYFFLAFDETLPPGKGWGKVKEAATLALQKDATLPEAHGAMALAKLHYDWDIAGAEQEFKRALELNPSDADIHHDYAHYLMALGRVKESEKESQRALELDPMGDSIVGCLCWHSFAARDYDKSIQLAEKVLARGDDPWERTILGWDYEQEHKPEQAIVEFKKAAAAAKGQGLYVAALGHAYAMAGRRADAEQVLHELLQRPASSYVSPFDIAVIYTALGNKDAAFAWLDKAVAERSTFLMYSKWEPRLDPLRADPRFQQLLARVGLPQ